MNHWTVLNAMVYLAAKSLNKPYVFCPAGALHIFGRSLILKKIYNLVIGEKITQNANRCIAITNAEKKQFIDYGVSPGKIDVIPNAVNEADFVESDEEGFRNKDDEEDFRNKDEDEEGFRGPQLMKVKNLKNMNEGFMNKVFQNISLAGYNRPGFGMAGPLLEGFQDEKAQKVEKKQGKPAPALKKETMAMPFKLGEIPSQVKNGPHIDAGSTLMKAVQSLNPDQINAMTKDTKQLIETQKSLMGMLGTMKPMMNDGKELMETFQQMFGQTA